MSGGRAIIIAARRTAIGKLGGMHKSRSIDLLTAPLIPIEWQEEPVTPPVLPAGGEERSGLVTH